MKNNQLPDFTCGSCGQCEKDYYKYRHQESTAGFCHKFKEVTTLSDKNLKCWTDKEVDFSNVFLENENQKKATDYRYKTLAKSKNILQSNQLNLF